MRKLYTHCVCGRKKLPFAEYSVVKEFAVARWAPANEPATVAAVRVEKL